jgi:uncharacterized sodium:solute symporter family permease YidK
VRQLAAALGLLWAAGSLVVAYWFVVGGLAAKTASKGLAQQALLLMGGLLIGLFALLLAWQCATLALSREPADS